VEDDGKYVINSRVVNTIIEKIPSGTKLML
jgi:hypothetical protein